MTEQDIEKSISKHSVKPIIAIVVTILLLDISNRYFFDDDMLSPTVLVLLAIGSCMYTFKKVLVDLFVIKNTNDDKNQKLPESDINDN